MAVAGLISLMVGLLALLFWAVTSALVFLLLIHAHRWAAFRRHQAYDYRSAPYKAALKLAAQQVATGLILIFAGMVATIKFNVNPGDPRIEYFFFLPFFLSVVFLGQRQAKFTIPLSGLWSAQIFWIPIGIAAQLLVFTGYHGFNFKINLSIHENSHPLMIPVQNLSEILKCLIIPSCIHFFFLIFF